MMNSMMVNGVFWGGSEPLHCGSELPMNPDHLYIVTSPHLLLPSLPLTPNIYLYLHHRMELIKLISSQNYYVRFCSLSDSFVLLFFIVVG